MTAGMAAGIGAIFHAPLAGALFSAEVLYREMDMEYEVNVLDINDDMDIEPPPADEVMEDGDWGDMGDWDFDDEDFEDMFEDMDFEDMFEDMDFEDMDFDFGDIDMEGWGQ